MNSLNMETILKLREQITRPVIRALWACNYSPEEQGRIKRILDEGMRVSDRHLAAPYMGYLPSPGIPLYFFNKGDDRDQAGMRHLWFLTDDQKAIWAEWSDGQHQRITIGELDGES